MCVIDIFCKYAWVVPLKDKKGIIITNVFQKILNGSNRKPNKIWVDKGSESYNNSFEKWLKDNNIEMYLMHNDGKSVVANDKDSKFKVGDQVRISKYKNIFSKVYTPNWSEEVFVIKNSKIQFHGNMLLMISMLKKLLEHFMKKNYKRQISKTLG